MRVLVVYAHPSEKSFVASLHAQVVASLRAGGHEVDDLDLYAEGFDPVLPRQVFLDYVNTSANQAGVAAYVERLRAAEAMVLVFPVWQDGFPAIMKGFFDRMFIPGVAFRLDANGFWPIMQNIRRAAAVATYGADRTRMARLGDPPRRFVKHNLGPLIAPGARSEYLACYDMNDATPARLAAFAAKVKRVFEAWRED
jgi:NAD(P)H dehydrogenase (quinone)